MRQSTCQYLQRKGKMPAIPSSLVIAGLKLSFFFLLCWGLCRTCFEEKCEQSCSFTTEGMVSLCGPSEMCARDISCFQQKLEHIKWQTIWLTLPAGQNQITKNASFLGFFFQVMLGVLFQPSATYWVCIKLAYQCNCQVWRLWIGKSKI